MRNVAEEAEDDFFVNVLRPAFHALGKLNTNPSLYVTRVHSVDINHPRSYWDVSALDVY